MNEDRSANLVLVGFMGTGKTTVGKMLAKRLQRAFVDLDREIEARAGQPIAKIFETQGELAFRDLERQVVQEVSARSNQVIACGGGVILHAENMRSLSSSGTLICLLASPAHILQRISNHSHRPLLEGEDREARLQKIYDERKALYEALPLKINTDGLGLQDVADRAEALFRDE